MASILEIGTFIYILIGKLDAIFEYDIADRNQPPGRLQKVLWPWWALGKTWCLNSSILQREVISVDSNMILYAVTYTVRKHHVIIGEVQHLLFLLWYTSFMDFAKNYMTLLQNYHCKMCLIRGTTRVYNRLGGFKGQHFQG